jgi:hypothetical protein
MAQNRRRFQRLPVGFYVEQIIDDDPHSCFTSDLNALGMYMERVATPLWRQRAVVQVEIPLPETTDSLWARAEVVYDRVDSLFHGTAVRFTGMARSHQRRLREWLREADHVHHRLGPNPHRPQVRVVRPSA